MKQTYHISGMSCAACAAAVEKSVRKLPGVKRADVNLLANKLSVEIDPEVVTPADIVQAVEKAGYGAEPLDIQAVVSASPRRRQSIRRNRTKRDKQRLSIRRVSIPCCIIDGAYGGLPLRAGCPVLPMRTVCVYPIFADVTIVDNQIFILRFKSLFHVPEHGFLIAIGTSAA